MPKTLLQEVNSQLNISLAPMYGVTDFTTRLFIFLLSSCDKMTTPFLRVTETYPHKIPLEWAPDIFDDAIKEKLAFQTRLQMMASCPKRFSQAFKSFESFLEDVELNCGCPSPKVVSHFAGSSLLRDPEYFSDFVSQIADNIGGDRFCVKMRTGYDSTEDFDRLIQGLARIPLKQLTIHGRTKADKYSFFSRNDLIHRASLILPYPVMASGDVVDRTSFQKAIKEMPNIKGIMIGRGALTNPFIFSEIKDENFSRPSNLSYFKEALLCYGLLVQISKDDFSTLKEIILDSDFQESYLDKEEKWRLLFLELYERNFKKKFTGRFEGDLDVSTLGRVKLLFANFVKGLFPFGSAKEVLRSKNAKDFFVELDLFFKKLLL
jgi:tRNA-dihydrouridine synthase